MRGRRRLADRLAIPARELPARVLDHLPARRLALQHLADILSQLAQVAASRAQCTHIDVAAPRPDLCGLQLLGQDRTGSAHGVEDDMPRTRVRQADHRKEIASEPLIDVGVVPQPALPTIGTPLSSCELVSPAPLAPH